MSQIRTLLQTWTTLRLPWRRTVLAGRDHFGNNYFEKREKDRIYPRRWVELTTDSDHYSQYDVNKVPVQWQSWLRHTRFDPPSVEEIAKADARRELIQQRAKEIDREWAKAKPIVNQLPPSPTHSASSIYSDTTMISSKTAPTTGRSRSNSRDKMPSSEPTGKGHDYEPGSWSAASRR
ncbi:hypothetical protein BJ085DRAFT_37246 [Dimargaris cristalligena]|uniref:NADH dehydrogenase [ubiquinone] 1 alpha subcomplex subunit n=1 Tax=Dimargaris cristalligena TaxID=215637 RepID=A0A4Q0A0X2_9FUNG|nr:hypothetical protein BJ085DRAFT_37246 [Dimargaris cristalligena]|eukprot:RKP39664.1 hypothetical protein BJ085DRAFT_37246 [Dimargaris cristalligena]